MKRPATDPRAPGRESLRRRLVQRFYTRFHMSLILMSCGLAAMLASWLLLVAGVDAMLVRYPVAVAVAYATFLLGVRLWLRYAGFAPKESGGTASSLVDDAGLPDIRSSGSGGGGGGGGFSGRGGSFDGGGASGSWAAESPAASGKSLSLPGFGGSGSSGGSGDVGGDDLAVVILALALVAAILFASGYLVWMAPDILTEAAFGAVLAGGLARRSRREDSGGWVAGVVKKTWWPFAIVLALAIAFAAFSAKHYPTAHTFRDVVRAATGG